MLRVILSLFCPVIIAIIIRVILFALAFVLALLGKIFNASKEIKELIENIGFFDTFIWDDSYLYWGIVVIVVFVAEIIIWSQTDNLKDNAKKTFTDMSDNPIYHHRDDSNEGILGTDAPVESSEQIEDLSAISHTAVYDNAEIETKVDSKTMQQNEEESAIKPDDNLSSIEKSDIEIKDEKKYKVDKGVLVIPEGETFIESYLSDHYDYFAEVIIPSSVIKICHNAFSKTLYLKSVIIPNSVTTIGDNAFDNSELSSAIIPNSVISIGAHAFQSCRSLSSVTIPNSVHSIGEGVFSGSGLKSITIPASIKSIPDWSFFNCHNLNSVHLHNSVTSIGDNAFSLCRELADIHMSNSLEYIGDFAFMGCQMKRFDIPNTVTYIGSSVFSDSMIETINIHKSTANFSSYTFSDSVLLEKINVDSDNTEFSSINGVLFNKDCTTLICVPPYYKTKIYHVPSTVCKIEDHAFQNCENIEEVILPDSLKEIGGEAFKSCLSLRNIRFSDSIEYVGLRAFAYCKNLSKECEDELLSFVTRIGRDRILVGLDVK